MIPIYTFLYANPIKIVQRPFSFRLIKASNVQYITMMHIAIHNLFTINIIQTRIAQ